MSKSEASDSFQNFSSQNQSLSLTESAESVQAVLRGCQAELDKLQQRLRGTLPEGAALTGNDDRRNTPHNHALYLALRLESCAEALRKAAETPAE